MKIFPKPINVHTAIAGHNLCCGCGVCAAICPLGCIEIKFDENLEYKPFVDSDTCTSCGLCINVCPSNQRTSFLAEKQFRESHSDAKENSFLGSFLNCYVGYVTKVEDRLASASGGLLTAVLEELLTRNFVDAAVVVGGASYKRSGKFFEAVIANNVEDVRRSRGSKYYPIEYSRVIKKICSEKGWRYAIVALPCAALAIRKAQLLNARLRENIFYILSPVCGHGVSAAYTEYLLKINGVEPPSVISINYRDKKGISSANDFNFTVKYRGEDGIKVKRFSFLSSGVGKVWCNYLFTPNKCFYCTDFAGEFSDASFADAWLPEYIGDVNGTSVVITRNAEVDQLIKKMTDEGKLHLSPISPEKVMKAQWSALQFKKESIKGRIRLKKILYRDFPDYGINYLDISIIEAIRKNLRLMVYAHLSKLMYRRTISLIKILT
ncbi:MAG: Coenzyme F420 hydrogenase/dehydrogenase, beta subunit C-terminal domain [Candidatus Bathyarchaeia archaeon]